MDQFHSGAVDHFQSGGTNSAYPVQEWLVQEIGRAFGVGEATAFANGTGTAQPKGYTTYTINASPTATSESRFS